MKSLLIWIFVALAGLTFSMGSQARMILGPFVDLREVKVPIPNGGTDLWITGTVSPHPPIVDFCHCQWSPLRTTPLAVGGILFIADTIDGSSYDVTTIYGIDAHPENAILSLVGQPTPVYFTPAGENIVGNSGAIYQSYFSAAATLSELTATLPGYDLSPFSESPEAAIFYHFTTSVPVSEITFTAVPLPTPMVLLVSGLVLITASARRRIWTES